MKIFILLFIYCVVVGDVFAEIYKWIDEEGKVHYGDCPPVKYEAQKVEPARVPCEEDVRNAKERLKKLLGQQQHTIEQAKEVKEKIHQEKAAKQQQMVENKKRCTLAQQNLHTLSLKRAVYSINEKGERVYMDDVTRAEEIVRLKKVVQTYCVE